MITLSQLRNWGIVANDGTIPSYPSLTETICRQVIQELINVVNTQNLQDYLDIKNPRGRKFVIVPDDIVYHLVRKVKDILYENER
jgi:hypothetical protein